MDEKRKTERVERTLIVQYGKTSTDPAKPLIWDSSTVRNISAEGILFNSNKQFTENEKLCLRFQLPTDPFHSLEVTAQVVETGTNKIHAKFIDLDEKQKKTIEEFVVTLLNKVDKKKI